MTAEERTEMPGTAAIAWRHWDWSQLPEPLVGAVQMVEKEVQAKWGPLAGVVAARPTTVPEPVGSGWTKLQNRFDWAELPEAVLARLTLVETAIQAAGEPLTVLLGVRPRRRYSVGPDKSSPRG